MQEPESKKSEAEKPTGKPIVWMDIYVKQNVPKALSANNPKPPNH